MKHIQIPPAPPAPRRERKGHVELLLQCVEKLIRRTLSEYESGLLLTIMDSVIAEMREGSSDVSGQKDKTFSA